MDRTDNEKSNILALLNHHRIILASQVDREQFEVSITHQPIVTTEESKIQKKFKAIAAAIGTGFVSGVAGAGVGATIGALAIGLPTFGVAAIAGLFIGAAIGGGIGIVVGAGAYGIIDKFVVKKHILDQSIVVDIKFGVGLM